MQERKEALFSTMDAFFSRGALPLGGAAALMRNANALASCSGTIKPPIPACAAARPPASTATPAMTSGKPPLEGAGYDSVLLSSQKYGFTGPQNGKRKRTAAGHAAPGWAGTHSALAAVPARINGKSNQIKGVERASAGARRTAPPVVTMRSASGSIGKVARGASAFLVFAKPVKKWLFVCCASEVSTALDAASSYFAHFKHFFVL
jgi:hypothetical protein